MWHNASRSNGGFGNDRLPRFCRPPADNYMTSKADGMYLVPSMSIITLQHVQHLRQMTIKATGRSFTIPLNRWDCAACIWGGI